WADDLIAARKSFQVCEFRPLSWNADFVITRPTAPQCAGGSCSSLWTEFHGPDNRVLCVEKRELPAALAAYLEQHSSGLADRLTSTKPNLAESELWRIAALMQVERVALNLAKSNTIHAEDSAG